MQCWILPLSDNKWLFYKVLASPTNSPRVNANFAGAGSRSGAPAVPIHELQLELDSCFAAGRLKLAGHSCKALLAGQKEGSLRQAIARSAAGQIAKRFSHSWPTTTRHLNVLQEAELLTVESEGRERIYRVDHKRLARMQTGFLKWFGVT